MRTIWEHHRGDAPECRRFRTTTGGHPRGTDWGFLAARGSGASLHIGAVLELRPSLRLQEAERRRVFVIVSDALRYEIAEELTRLLNGAYRFEAELTSQLDVRPSYTALGMASLPQP